MGEEEGGGRARGCAPAGRPGTLPAWPGPLPQRQIPCLPQRRALYPLIDAESLGFVIQQLIVSIPPRAVAVRAWPFLSLSVVPQGLGVFTLNSRPAKRIYSLIMELKTLLAWSWGAGGGGGVGKLGMGGGSVSLAPFSGETFGFMWRLVILSLSPSSACCSSLKIFCHVYWDNEGLFFYFYSNINVRK